MSFFDPQCEHDITGIDLAATWSNHYRRFFTARPPRAKELMDGLVELMKLNLAEHRKECTV